MEQNSQNDLSLPATSGRFTPAEHMMDIKCSAVFVTMCLLWFWYGSDSRLKYFSEALSTKLGI